jgi:hypothetical protein
LTHLPSLISLVPAIASPYASPSRTTDDLAAVSSRMVTNFHPSGASAAWAGATRSVRASSPASMRLGMEIPSVI